MVSNGSAQTALHPPSVLVISLNLKCPYVYSQPSLLANGRDSNSYNHKGKRLTADISYDMFLKSGSINPGSDCTPASEDHHYEVMIWLAAIGKRTLPGGKEVPFRPLGSKVKKGFTYKNKHGREFHFELYKGKNNPFNHPHEVTVYSFLPQNGQKYDEFEANLAPFLHDLAKNHEKAVGEATLQSIQAGTETVDAEHATFQTHEYSIGG